jgi:hypothetical protein
MICTGRGKVIPPTAKNVTRHSSVEIVSFFLSPEGTYLFTISILAEVS